MMLIQIVINALIYGLLLSLVALGFHAIFATTRIFHIAHGVIYVSSAFFYFAINHIFGIIPSIILTFLLSFMLGMLVEALVYKPLLNKSSNQNITLISSLGVYIILVNLIVLIFGNETKMLNNNISVGINIGQVIITQPQINQICFAIPLIVAFLIFMKLTGLGLRVRAVADNTILARVVGIKLQRIRYLVFGIGSVLASGAALLRANDVGIDPYSGMSITLSAAVVVIIGGTRSYYGTIIGAIVLSIIQNFTEFYLSSQWKDTATFTLLIVVLLWRTEGILQFKIRTDEK